MNRQRPFVPPLLLPVDMRHYSVVVIKTWVFSRRYLRLCSTYTNASKMHLTLLGSLIQAACTRTFNSLCKLISPILLSIHVLGKMPMRYCVNVFIAVFVQRLARLINYWVMS